VQSIRIEVSLESVKGLENKKEQKDKYSTKNRVEGAGEERGKTDLRE